MQGEWDVIEMGVPLLINLLIKPYKMAEGKLTKESNFIL